MTYLYFVKSKLANLSIFHHQHISEALLELASTRGVNGNNVTRIHGFDKLFYIVGKNMAANVARSSRYLSERLTSYRAEPDIEKFS